MASPPACSLCEELKHECAQGCIYAPHFPADRPERFALINEAFKPSYVTDVLRKTTPANREELLEDLASFSEDPSKISKMYLAQKSLEEKIKRLEDKEDYFKRMEDYYYKGKEYYYKGKEYYYKAALYAGEAALHSREPFPDEMPPQ